MEQLLQTHGGTYVTDFGLRETIDFGIGKSKKQSNNFYSCIKDNTLEKLNEQMSPNSKKISQGQNIHNEQFRNPLSPSRTPSKKPESITEITRLFAAKNANKIPNQKVKSKPLKLINNLRQKKKKKFKRNDLNFKTPPPQMPYNTIDPNFQPSLYEASFQEFNEEGEINFSQKQNLNMLKASISKLSIDFVQDRQFLQGLKQKNNRNQFDKLGGSPFIKSAEGFSFEQSDSKLPSIINQTANARNAIKSPVMESIRRSRQNK